MNNPDSASILRQEAAKASLENAGTFIEAAKKIESHPPAAYTLATLALEEIGKSILFSMCAVSEVKQESWTWAEESMTDHVKKLTWALFGPLLNKIKLTRQDIDDVRDLAKEMHSMRLRASYVEIVDGTIFKPSEQITPNNTGSLIKLADARLQVELAISSERANPEQIKKRLWLIDAINEPDQAAFIFGQESMSKLEELSSFPEWIDWLEDSLTSLKRAAEELLQKELSKEPASQEEPLELKWQFNIHLFSDSHTIKQKDLNIWNRLCNYIQLKPVDKKRPNQMYVQFSLPKQILLNTLWWVGWGYANRFIVGLNIATRGFFWWHPEPPRGKYYTGEIADLEQPQFKITCVRSPILKVRWGQPKQITKMEIQMLALCWRFLPGPSTSPTPFDAYLAGLAYLGKTDIYMQFEPQAFRCFFEALRSALQEHGHWDGLSDYRIAFVDTMSVVFKDTGAFKDSSALGEYVDRYEELLSQKLTEEIDLSGAASMKVLCDFYFQWWFQQRALAERTTENDLIQPEGTQDKEEMSQSEV